MGTSAAPGGDPQPVTEAELVADLIAELESLESDVKREVGADDPGLLLRLTSLKDAFIAGTVTQGWAGVDVVRALNPESVGTVLRGRMLRSKRLGEMERIRNILALVPVLLTWLGLYVASISYKIVTDANPALLTRPFLLLWEEGFPGGFSIWGIPVAWLFALSHVAIMDVVVLLVMLYLTWRIHLETNIRQAAIEHLAQTLQRRIEHAGWRASLILARRTSPQVGVDVFRDASNQLLSEMRAWNEEIRNLATARAEQTAALTQAAANFRSVATELSGMARDAKGSFETMIGVVTQLGDRIRTLDAQQESIEEALSGVGPALVAHAAALQQGLNLHSTSIQASLEGNATSLRSSLEANSAAVQGGLTRNASAIQTSLDAYANTMKTGIADLTTTANQFRESAGEALSATASIAESAQHIEATLSRVQAANAQQLRDGSQQIASAVQAVSGSVSDLQKALTEHQQATTAIIREGSAQVEAATRSVAGVVSRIGGAVNALEQRVGEERQSYDAAAGAARRAAQELEAAVRVTSELTAEVQRTARQVTEIADPLSAIDARLESLADALTSTSGTMARSVNTFTGGAEHARDRLNATADELADVGQRLSVLLTALETQAREAGLRISRRKSRWDPRRLWED